MPKYMWFCRYHSTGVLAPLASCRRVGSAHYVLQCSVQLCLYRVPTCQHAGLIHSPLCFLTVVCLHCNNMRENHEDEVHLEMPVQTESISQFLMEFEWPNVLDDYRCTLCHCLGNKRETMMIMVPAPYLVFHKIGGGDVVLEQHIDNRTVSVKNTCSEYLYSVFSLPMSHTM